MADTQLQPSQSELHLTRLSIRLLTPPRPSQHATEVSAYNKHQGDDFCRQESPPSPPGRLQKGLLALPNTPTNKDRGFCSGGHAWVCVQGLMQFLLKGCQAMWQSPCTAEPDPEGSHRVVPTPALYVTAHIPPCVCPVCSLFTS